MPRGASGCACQDVTPHLLLRRVFAVDVLQDGLDADASALPWTRRCARVERTLWGTGGEMPRGTLIANR